MVKSPLQDDLLIVIPGAQAKTNIVQHLDAEILLAYLRRAGFRASILDQMLSALHPSDLCRHLNRSPQQTVLWHLPTRREFQALQQAATAVDQHHSTKGAWFAGGFFASHHDTQVLEALPALDAIVRGELELPVESVCRALRGGRAWHDSPGITLRTPEMPVRNPVAANLLDPKLLPAADDDLFHPSRHEIGQKILFSRGCNSDCQYCGFQVFFRDSFPGREKFWRSRSADSIADEIELYAHRHGVSRFVFHAGVFFGYDSASAKVVERVAEEILRRGLRIRFKIVTHPHHLVRNQHLLPLLTRAGLDLVVLGVDSGSEAALRRFRVEFSRDQGLEALAILHAHRLTFNTGFIFYDSYMDLEEVGEQLRFLRRAAPYFAHMAPSYPWFLDHQLLHKMLKISSFMPLTETLVADGLTSEAAEIGEVRRGRFRYPAVARFHRIHQAIERRYLRKLRPLLWNRACVDRHPQLELLPLDLLDELLEIITTAPQRRPPDDDEMIDTVAGKLADRLSGLEDLLRGPHPQEQRRQSTGSRSEGEQTAGDSPRPW